MALSFHLLDGGYGECAENRSCAGADEQEGVGLGALVEDSTDEDGQEAVEREAEECGAKGEDDKGAHAIAMAYEADAFFHAVEDGFGGPRWDELHVNHEERDDDGDIGDTVEREAPCGTERGVGQTSDGGTDDAGEVELDGVHRDGIGEVFGVHECGKKGGVGGATEGLAGSHEEGEAEDVPDFDSMGYEEQGEQEGADHLDVLRDEQHLATIKAVGEDSAEEREQHDGELAEEEVEAEVEGVFGEVVYEPTLRELLDDSSNGGDAGSGPHQAKVAIAEGSEDAC